ncbi:MAG: hypothetical protein IJJ59_11825 [Pseudobutyrivibrio sp.]|uniref:DUF6548 family protein n=1 Tax=Pseudobutyrivibrio sp. TaxID=2014367 RepID=UPI001B605920|nr:DUF6548 family protein [Pseudobutyrivibrio sp.]MBP3727953.1 hypothetical protein [Pseudobutyrivibrio sp.]MBQ6464001.1 hypothetical protein [Pseudobutyrivibrio sp.]
MHKNRITNENFYDEYCFFDDYLADYLNVDENGVTEYIKRMKEAIYEVKDVLPEWMPSIARFEKIKARFESLDNAQVSFDDFQGKDEDVVWMRILMEKIEAGADPLTKYSKLKFTFKKRKKSLLQRFFSLFN